MQYLCMLRGINVGGKNKISMSELKAHLEQAGFKEVITYINSGNVILSTRLNTTHEVEQQIEKLLPQKFKLDSEIIKIRAITKQQLTTIVNKAPKGFGSQSDTYHSDVLFPMGVTSAEIMKATRANPDVDASWEANGVVYYQRLSSQRTKSHLSRIVSQPEYKNMTIRNWNTTVKLLGLFR